MYCCDRGHIHMCTRATTYDDHTQDADFMACIARKQFCERLCMNREEPLINYANSDVIPI